MEPITDKVQELFLHNKQNSNKIHLEDTTLAAVSEAGNGENWCIIDNKSTYNAFINDKYLPNMRDALYGKYIGVHYNSGVTYTNNIRDLPGYSNHVRYNPN